MAVAEKMRGDGPSSKRQGIQSLEIGIRLFQELHQLKRPATLSELSNLSHMPPAKAHRYCVSLIRTGLMQQDGRGRYGVGPYGFQLSHPRTNLEHSLRLATEILPALVRKIGETAFISAWGQTGPFIIKVEDALKPIAIRPNTRGDMPLWNSATGRVFAAYLPRERLDPLIEAELCKQKADEKLTVAAVIARRATFEKHLAQVRRRKLARTTGERYPGLVSFAAPIFGGNGEVVLALTSFGLATTLASSWDGPVPVALKGAAQELTPRIGGVIPG
jgi:DNA-binding IclR family transcriptional regulator